MNEPEDATAETSGLARAARLAIVIVGLTLAGLALWAWLSSGSDAGLPFGYEGFD